jgi:hypothetical protein
MRTPDESVRGPHCSFELVQVEVEDIDDLEVGSIDQHQVASDENVNMIRGRRRQERFYFPRARLHFAAESVGKGSAKNQLALQPRRKTIALCQPRRQAPVMCAVPLVEIAIVIGIPVALPIVSIMLVFFVPVGVSVAMIVIAVVIITITVVSAVTMVVMVLRYCDGCRESHRYERDSSGSKEILQRHCGLL